MGGQPNIYIPLQSERATAIVAANPAPPGPPPPPTYWSFGGDEELTTCLDGLLPWTKPGDHGKIYVVVVGFEAGVFDDW